MYQPLHRNHFTDNRQIVRIPYLKGAVCLLFFVLAGHAAYRSLPGRLLSHFAPQNVSASLVAPSQQDLRREDLEDEIAIPLEWKMGTWVARVELNDLYEAQLIVDSGATFTTVSEDMAFDIGLAQDPRLSPFSVETANGKTHAWLGRLRSLQVGEAVSKDFSVGVQDLSNLTTEGVDGVLGLNFLNGFAWRVDQKNGQLILRPKT